ncbi:hypothetical protein ACSBR1_018409 [Camellia fascicularis]
MISVDKPNGNLTSIKLRYWHCSKSLAVTAVILSAAALHSPSLLSAHRRCFLLTATALCSSMMDHSCVVAG